MGVASLCEEDGVGCGFRGSGEVCSEALRASCCSGCAGEGGGGLCGVLPEEAQEGVGFRHSWGMRSCAVRGVVVVESFMDIDI